MRRIISSPGRYIQGKGELANLSADYKELGTNGAYVMVDKFILDTYGDRIKKGFEDSQVPYIIEAFGGECSDVEINRHKDKLGASDVVIGIGGGKTLDTSKAVAHHANLPVIIVPTTASTDAPCSRLTVVYTEDGVFDHFLHLRRNPDMVVMDTEVIASAPARFLAAGIGDALATYYEAVACNASNSVTTGGGHVTNAAMALATVCRDILLENGHKAMVAVENKQCTKAVEDVIEANTYLSGVGFESGGLAAIHAIHDGLTALHGCHHMLHGEKVAFSIIAQLVLENTDEDEVMMIINFLKQVGLPTCFKDLGLENVTDEELMTVAKISCEEDETIYNLPFPVTAEDVFAALKVADQLGK